MKDENTKATLDKEKKINGYIDMLRSRYLEFKESTERQYDQVLDMELESPRLYLITTAYNLPSWMRNGSIGGALNLDLEAILQYTHQNSILLHNHICNKTVKNHFRKKNIKFLPVGLSFIDLSQSKSHKYFVHTLPHTHAIYLIHPFKVKEFEKFASSGFRLKEAYETKGFQYFDKFKNTINIQTVDGRLIANTENDLYRATSYAAKFHLSDFNQSLHVDIRDLSFDVMNKLK